jgi:hypothetical protein
MHLYGGGSLVHFIFQEEWCIFFMGSNDNILVFYINSDYWCDLFINNRGVMFFKSINVHKRLRSTTAHDQCSESILFFTGGALVCFVIEGALVHFIEN